MFKNKALILAKVETVYNTDAAPTGPLNAILCEEPKYSVLDSKVERANIKPAFGANGFVAIGEGQRISFTTELKGSGTAATPPEIGVLFRACNMTQTISTYVQYDPNSSTAGESLTLWYYVDGICHKLTGCRGTFSLEGKVNQYVKINWEFTGIYAGPVPLALATPTYTATVPPLFRNAAFTVDAYAAVIDGISLDMKNDIVKRVDLNAATGILEWAIKERTCTGKIDPEMVLPATYDFWGKWQAGATAAMTVTVGATAGNRCTITAPAVQYDRPDYGARENTLTLGIPLVFRPTAAGNDEIRFKFD